MKKKILFVAAVLIGSQLLAQQDSTHQLLEEIVVTASKYPKKISETGKVLTVITPAQLERSSGKDLSQLLNEQAGLIINGSSSNPGKDKNIFLQGAIGKYSLILLDGVPVNDASGAGGAFDLRLLSIAEVERIEILKGSQSTLYGSDAIAGVINIITKKGGKKPLSANGLVSYGSWNSFKTNAGINGRVNWFDYNLGYAYTGTDGISEASDEKNNTGIGFDRDGYKQHALQASLGIQVSKLLRLNPFIRYNRFKGQYDDDAFTDGRDTNLSKFLNTGMQAVYQLSKGSLNANYAFEQTDRRFAGTYGTYQFKGQFNNAEIFFHYDLTKMLQLLAGLNYQDLKMLDTAASKKNPSVHFTSPYASLFLHNLGITDVRSMATISHIV